MSCVQPQLDYLMATWNLRRVITYPTPPYLTLRINVGLHQGPPLSRPRLLLDMIRKFSTAEEGRYFRPNRDEESISRLGKVYRKGTSQISQIHDERNKWIFYGTPSVLKALPKQNSEGEKFEITNYSQESNTNKVPITLKIYGKNLYLSCDNGQLTLENNNETLDIIDDSTKRFLFFRTRGIKGVTFESAVSEEMYISTNVSTPSPVNLSKLSDPTKIVSFVIDEEVGRRFFMIGKERFSLQEPMEILEILEEYDQLLENIYERFAYRPYSVYW